MKSLNQDIESSAHITQSFRKSTVSRIYVIGALTIAKTKSKAFFMDATERGKVATPDSETNQDRSNSETTMTTGKEELTSKYPYRIINFAKGIRVKLSEDTRSLIDSISQRIDLIKEEDLNGDLDQGSQSKGAPKISFSRLDVYRKGISNELICRAVTFKENALKQGYELDYEFRKRRQQREAKIKSLAQQATSWAGIATKQDMMEINRMVYQLAKTSNSIIPDESGLNELERRKQLRRRLDVPVLYDQRINARRQQFQS